MERRFTRIASIVLAAGWLLAGAPAAAGDAPDAGTYSTTLITGDRVELRVAGDGRARAIIRAKSND
jgi:hypothetical protein